MQKVQQNFMPKRPAMNVGDTVSVHTVIRDGDKKRIQRFEGLVISTKGSGTDSMFTVRKISYGIGVEKIFPTYSTNIEKIEVKKHAAVRRSKLYYLRDRVGKAAMKLKAGAPVVIDETPENYDEEAASAEVELAEEPENTEASSSDEKDEQKETSEKSEEPKTEADEATKTEEPAKDEKAEAKDDKKENKAEVTENKKEEKSK